jgi:tetratricopeptide (TPR) repeat protein
MMKSKAGTFPFYIPLLFIVVLSACAHKSPDAGVSFADQNSTGLKAAPSATVADDNVVAYPKMELTGQMLYTFLLADIAAQRGQTDLAAQGYIEMTKLTRDPRAARRAAQLAYESRNMEQALQAFKLWNELEPKVAMPKQMLATVLLSGGKLAEAHPYLLEVLAAEPKNTGKNFVQFYPLFARYKDKVAVYSMLKELAQPYPDLAETHFVVAQAAEAANQHEEALHEVRVARKQRPDWDMAALLESQLLKESAPEAALSVAKEFLSDFPEANEVRLFYARFLLEQKQYSESRIQFKKLLKTRPDNADLAFAIALLSIQMGEFERAETELKQTLAFGKKDAATVHYYLAQLKEAKKEIPAALLEYQQVQEGEYAFPSRLRVAYLLAQTNKVAEARNVLQETVVKNPQQQEQIIVTEVQLLREAKLLQQGFQVANKGLELLPNNQTLLYEAAMLADKLGKLSVAEETFRKLIKVAPEHAHAYNALGYSMMERKVRLPEAMKLVEKAYELEPDDAAILDSMGWGHYLTGNLDKGIVFLRRAYAVFPDPEVAAHLGEVLWQQGAQAEAKRIWQESLSKNPENSVLKSVINKFIP